MGKRRSEHSPQQQQPCADDGGGVTKHKSVCFYYDPRISYADYGETHAMVPHRVTMTHALISAFGLLDDMDLLGIAPATEDDLKLAKAHDENYIKFLRDLTLADYNADAKTQKEAAKKYKLGEIRTWDEHKRRFTFTHDNPVMENLWDYCQRYAGGSLAAARALASGRYKVAINWSGGMHHACQDKAGGFCYVNDIVIAIKALLHHGRRFIKRVLYLDIDAHHGDGVETAFQGDSQVLTVSFHQFDGEFFPGTGAAIDVADGMCPTLINVPLETGTGDEVYHQMFGPIVDRVMAVFEPDAVVMQCGADSLAGDRLAGLRLSVHGHAKCVSIVKGYGLPLLLLGGGGYTINRVASCWCYETAVTIGKEIPDDIPQHGYQNYYKSQEYNLHYHKEDNSGTSDQIQMDEKAIQIIMEKVMKHLDCLSSMFMPKPPMLSMEPCDRGEPPHASARSADRDEDALVVMDRSPRDEDPVERLHRRCSKKMLRDFFTDLGRKHPKRA